MKKIICCIGILLLLFIGSVGVLADPKTEPGNCSYISVPLEPPIPIVPSVPDTDS